MKAVRIAITTAFATTALASAAFAQGKGIERLYIVECGQGHTGDMSRWTPGQLAPSIDHRVLRRPRR